MNWSKISRLFFIDRENVITIQNYDLPKLDHWIAIQDHDSFESDKWIWLEQMTKFESLFNFTIHVNWEF